MLGAGDDRELSRRELVALGAAAGGAGFAALGAQAALADKPPPSPLDTLNYAASSELLAVFAYTHVNAHPELTPAVAALTAVFLAHEQQHAQLIIGVLATMGQPAPTPPNTVGAADAQLQAHGGTMSLSALQSQRDCLKLLQEVESVLEGAYFRAASSVSDPTVLRTIAEIMAAEGQHWTAITGLRHPGQFDRAVPSAFVEGMY